MQMHRHGLVPMQGTTLAFCSAGCTASPDCSADTDKSRGGSRGGVAGVATPPNDFEQPLPLIYKAYYSLAQ